MSDELFKIFAKLMFAAIFNMLSILHVDILYVGREISPEKYKRCFKQYDKQMKDALKGLDEVYNDDK